MPLLESLSPVEPGEHERDRMIVSVASGKGGTGKTLVATSLAGALKDTHDVRILDCDVEEPNDYLFLKPVKSNDRDSESAKQKGFIML